MTPFRLLSASEQVADRLRREMLQGVRSGDMCGSDQLAIELGIGRKTAEQALRQLEREGLLLGQGLGCRRQIAPLSAHGPRPLRLCILFFQRGEQREPFVAEIQHNLQEAGHVVILAEKSLLELDMNPKRIAHLVGKTNADGWILFAGSREVLEWFITESIPAFAVFGACAGLPIASAGPNKTKAVRAATRELFRQGHTRVSLICRRMHRTPNPNRVIQAFLDELNQRGIRTGDFNCPDWDETPSGLFDCLDHLFHFTPPTALIVDEIAFLFAVQQFLGRRSLRVPDDVSLVCIDNDPVLSFCDLSIAHIDWNFRPILRHVVRWASSLSRGKPEVRQITSSAVFVSGGTIGPAPRAR